MTDQPLALTRDGWTCAWCAAPIKDGHIRHREDCRWIEDLIELGIERGEQGRTRL